MIKHLKDGTKPFIRNSNGNISCWCLCIVIRACCKLPIVHSWLGPVYTSVVVTLSAPAPCLLMSPSRHLPSPFTWVSAKQVSITTSSVKHRSPDYPGGRPSVPCDATCYPLVPTCDRWHVMLQSSPLTCDCDMCTGDLNAVMLKTLPWD